MNRQQIIDKIVEMLCDLHIDDQLEILEETKMELNVQWDEMCSAAWEGFVP